MVTSLENKNVCGEAWVRTIAKAVLVGVAVAQAGCAKQEAQAPKPEPAAAEPSERSYEQEHLQGDGYEWPGAVGAGATAPLDDALAEKKAAAKASPAPVTAAPPADQARDRRLEIEASQPARPAAAKPKAKASLGRGAKAIEEELAEWGRSVALLEESFDQFENAMALSTPDCPAADKFRQTVCTLAEHICSLEEQVPTTTKQRCDDGRQRCEQAGQKYRARCDKE